MLYWWFNVQCNQCNFISGDQNQWFHCERLEGVFIRESTTVKGVFGHRIWHLSRPCSLFGLQCAVYPRTRQTRSSIHHSQAWVWCLNWSPWEYLIAVQRIYYLQFWSFEYFCFIFIWRKMQIQYFFPVNYKCTYCYSYVLYINVCFYINYYQSYVIGYIL